MLKAFFPCGLLLLLGGLSGCLPHKSSLKDGAFKDVCDAYTQNLQDHLPRGFSIDFIEKKVTRRRYGQASRYVQDYLVRHPKNSYLHFLNGLIYRMVYDDTRDSQALTFSHVAFQNAYDLNPSKWYFSYILGKSYCYRKEFSKARDVLVHSLSLNNQQPQIPYLIAYASYHLKDFDIAYGAINRALQLEGAQKIPDIHHMAALIFGACGRKDLAYKSLDTLSKTGKYASRVEKIYQEVDTLCQSARRALRKSGLKLASLDEDENDQLTFASEEFDETNPDPGGSQSQGKPANQAEGPRPPAKGSEEGKTKTKGDQAKKAKEHEIKNIILDGYLLREHLTNAQDMGQDQINRTLNIAGPNDATVYNYTQSESYEQDGNNVRDEQKTVRSAKGFKISQEKIEYGLTAMESTTSSIEVLARPTLALNLGNASVLLSGDQLAGAVIGSSGGSSSFAVDVGLQIVAKLISCKKEKNDYMVEMDIEVLGSHFFPNSLNPSSSSGSGGIASRSYEISRSSVKTRVKAPLGSTIVLGGISNRDHTVKRDGVPILQDLPIFQYFFANKNKSSVQTNILFLATTHLPEEAHQMAEPHGEEEAERIRSLAYLRKDGIMTMRTVPVLYHITQAFKRMDFVQGLGTTAGLSLNWEENDLSTREKMKQLCSFLYF